MLVDSVGKSFCETTEFDNFVAAKNCMKRTIKALFEQKEEVTIQVLAVSMKYSWGELLDEVLSQWNGKPKLRLEFLLGDVNRIRQLDPRDDEWSQHLKGTYRSMGQFMRSNRKKLGDRLDIAIYEYWSLPPVQHGLLIDDSVLFVSTCSFEQDGSGQYRMLVGQNKYCLFERSANEEQIVDFKQFIGYYKQNSIPRFGPDNTGEYRLEDWDLWERDLAQRLSKKMWYGNNLYWEEIDGPPFDSIRYRCTDNSDVFLTSILLKRVIPAHADKLFVRILKNHGNIRIVLPHAKVIRQAYNQNGRVNPKDELDRYRGILRIIREHLSKYENFELRLADFLPVATVFIINAEKPDAALLYSPLQYDTHNTDLRRPGSLVIKKEHPNWFDSLYQRYYVKMWEDAGESITTSDLDEVIEGIKEIIDQFPFDDLDNT